MYLINEFQVEEHEAQALSRAGVAIRTSRAIVPITPYTHEDLIEGVEAARAVRADLRRRHVADLLLLEEPPA